MLTKDGGQTMKKLLALLLSAALLCGTALPALAEPENADARLTQVTQAVKSTLDLDTTAYTDFHGDSTEDILTPVWYLTWTGDTGSLTIEALENGTVISYSISEYTETPEPLTGSTLPAFPAVDNDAATAAAQAFLDKVLDKRTESAELKLTRSPDLSSGDYRFTADILLNGLPSPLSLSITVRAEDMEVIRFSRDVLANSCLGGIPSATPSTTQAQATALLRDTLDLRLEYVPSEDDSSHAVLRYLPEYGHDFYVDATTGELIDLTELENGMFKNGLGAGAAADSTESAPSAPLDKGELTEAEQAGIQRLEGVQSKEALDAGLRSVKEYGLTGYELVSTSYTLLEGDKETEDRVTCALQYSCSSEDGVWRRTFTMDAKTGVVEGIYSQGPWNEERKPVLTAEEAQAKAKAFLDAYYPDHTGHLELYESYTDSVAEGSPFYSFTFARQENGYFFPSHYYAMGIDSTDGSVSSLSFTYEENVIFGAPDGIIDAEAALDAWLSTYDVTLGYLYVPEPLVAGDTAQDKLLQLGFQSFYHLKLGYTLEREGSYLGIDAKTGEPVARQYEPSEGLNYTDLEGHWAQATVETLAGYGVGYDADTFGPEQALTQWDLVSLLYSLDYCAVDPASEDQDLRNEVYAAAYRAGTLTKEERNDNALLTRASVIKMLLDRAGYGKVAGLEGIFTCAFDDQETIPEGELGYAALAQGLGLVEGAYAGQRTATRAEAAILLYRLMES